MSTGEPINLSSGEVMWRLQNAIDHATDETRPGLLAAYDVLGDVIIKHITKASPITQEQAADVYSGLDSTHLGVLDKIASRATPMPGVADPVARRRAVLLECRRLLHEGVTEFGALTAAVDALRAADSSGATAREQAFREGYWSGYTDGGDLDKCSDVEAAVEQWRAGQFTRPERKTGEP
jgi:hypothetical protein